VSASQVRRVVVVTGASAGVGRAAARAFADDGAAVALLARHRGRLDSACEEIRAAGGVALGLVVDVADPEQVEAAAARVERELGPIDVWVNNAMVTIVARIDDLEPEEVHRVTDVTYHGTVHGTLAALRRMRVRNRGVIVQVGSALAYRSIPLQAPYCAAKAAARGFTDSLRAELIHDRSQIRVTMVHLSAFNTPQFDWARNRTPQRLQPVPPIFQPEIAARAIVRASYGRHRELWVGWPAVKAIFFNRLAPWIADRVVAKQAFEGQHTDEPARKERPDNLFDSVDAPFAAHGRFDDRAKDASAQQWLSKHARWVATAATLAAVAAAMIFAT
jgi:NAD(P)-dependent dehydrogenase (short-subunit alcohol dehydrogenase family)